MKEVDLLRFITQNEVEYHWTDDDVIMFVSHWNIKEFMMDLLGHQYLTDGEVQCILKYGYIGVWMKSICEYFDIELKSIFDKKNYDD